MLPAVCIGSLEVDFAIGKRIMCHIVGCHLGNVGMGKAWRHKVVRYLPNSNHNILQYRYCLFLVTCSHKYLQSQQVVAHTIVQFTCQSCSLALQSLYVFASQIKFVALVCNASLVQYQYNAEGKKHRCYSKNKHNGHKSCTLGGFLLVQFYNLQFLLLGVVAHAKLRQLSVHVAILG